VARLLAESAPQWQAVRALRQNWAMTKISARRQLGLRAAAPRRIIEQVLDLNVDRYRNCQATCLAVTSTGRLETEDQWRAPHAGDDRARHPLDRPRWPK